MAACINVSSLNRILYATGSQCNRCSAAVMLWWSRRRSPRTTLAAARCTISSLCSNVPVIPHKVALPKSSLDVTSACTSVLHALIGRDDRIRLMDRSCAYAVRHVRLTCAAIDIVESSCTPRSRMLLDAMMLHPHTSVLPRPFSEGGTPCRFLVTPCPFQEAEMTPCPFLGDAQRRPVTFYLTPSPR